MYLPSNREDPVPTSFDGRKWRLVALIPVLLFHAATAWGQPDTASYSVRFDATWTAETHPQSYPPGPHFSGLVGGTHGGGVDFWEDGQLATLGIQRMAEWGTQTDLVDEVQAAINAGTAEFVITAPPLWTVPGDVSTTFTVSEAFPLVTLVCMIAPSPDWFVGVDGLDLRPGGAWVGEIVVDLFPWDAGTDSGANYTSGDLATVPPAAIQAMAGPPFEPGIPIGSLTFTLQAVSDVPPPRDQMLRVWPNPFNPRTTVAWELPQAGPLRVTVHDLAGRRVRVLREGLAQAGHGAADWDGRDRSGRQMPSAAYLIMVEAPGFRARRLVTLLK